MWCLASFNAFYSGVRSFWPVANASGFLLVSLSKTPRVDFCFQPQSLVASLDRKRLGQDRAKSNLGAYDLPTQDFTIEGCSTSGGLNIGGRPVIRWIGESAVSMRELLLAQDKKQIGPTAVEEAMALIECELTDQPRPANEIIAVLNQAGVKEATRNRAKSRLFFSRGRLLTEGDRRPQSCQETPQADHALD